MGEKTGISWCDATANFWQGCHKLSAGCAHCYMFEEKKRYGQNPNVVVRSSEATFNAPLKWARNPQKYGHIKRVFVCSWSDFFIEEADPWRAEAWEIMRKTPQFIYQLCTKRPERIAACLPPDWGKGYPNVWLLTSTENQAAADLRIPILLSVPAVVHGISAEPLLGPIDLTHIDTVEWMKGRFSHYLDKAKLSGNEKSIEIAGDLLKGVKECNWEEGRAHWDVTTGYWFDGWDGGTEKSYKLNWVIVGGESGPNARPMESQWGDSIRQQCEDANVAFFFKQQGTWIDAGHEEFERLPEGKLVHLNSLGVQYGDNIPNDEDADVVTMKLVTRDRAGETLYGKVYHAFPDTERKG